LKDNFDFNQHTLINDKDEETKAEKMKKVVSNDADDFFDTITNST